MKKLMPYAGFLLTICCLTVTSFYLAYHDFSFLGFAKQGQGAGSRPNLWRILLLIVSTLLGITSGYFHVKLQSSSPSQFKLRNELKAMCYSPDYYRGLFASPIVFSVIYVAANQQPDDVIAFLLAFENGFFWNRVLEQRGKIVGG